MSADKLIGSNSNYWPRRLLRVTDDKLISIEQSGQCTYGKSKSPEYNILSYTWGRWEDAKGQALPIQNTAWEIPRVRKDAQGGFTVDAFRRVVEFVGKNTHMWLDVACIDQKDKPTKMDEIGKQAAIFKRAKMSYIWLSNTRASQVEPIIRRLVNRNEEVHTDRGWLRTVLQDIRLIFSDPWFSSLWVLQESFLRPGAILLFSEGLPINIPGAKGKPRPCSLFDLFSGCERLCTALQYEIRERRANLADAGIKLAEKIIQKCEDAGSRCIVHEHAMSLYAVSTLRNPRDQNDRIYGIAQVFGFVLGSAAEPHRDDFTLAELEDQFGAALNQANPVFAQFFVHTEPPRPMRAWCVSRKILVPLVSRAKYTAEAECSITFDSVDRLARFRGHKGRLSSVMRRLVKASGSDLVFDLFQLDRAADGAPGASATSSDSQQMHLKGSKQIQDQCQDMFGRDVSVLFIGSLCCGQISRWVGVLAYPSTSSGKVLWKRVGICLWPMEESRMRSAIGEVFSKESIFLM